MNESVRRILENSVYMTLATVAEDGAPWNVPLRFAFDEDSVYFKSPEGTQHGSNIKRDGRVSAVVIDTNQAVKGAVYLHSFAEKLDGEDEALAMRTFATRFDKPSQQWGVTEYYRFAIGVLDTTRSKGEMYYFETPRAT